MSRHRRVLPRRELRALAGCERQPKARASRRAAWVSSASLVFTLSSSARADVSSFPVLPVPLIWLVTAGILAFLLLLFGMFVFLVKPPREP